MDVRGPAGNQHLGPQNLSQLREHATKPEPSQVTSRSGSVAGDEELRHIRSPEIERLAARIQQLPEVREDLVNQALTRLSSGEYGSRNAAEQTASAILEGK